MCRVKGIHAFSESGRIPRHLFRADVRRENHVQTPTIDCSPRKVGECPAAEKLQQEGHPYGGACLFDLVKEKNSSGGLLNPRCEPSVPFLTADVSRRRSQERRAEMIGVECRHVDANQLIGAQERG